MARLDGEIIHFVVEKESGAAHEDLRTEAVIERVGDRRRVTLPVDNAVVRRLLFLAIRLRLHRQIG